MIAVVLLVVGIPAAEAAPLVPSSDLPGRERYRFTPSPLDRFMQPNPPARPLLQWDWGARRGWRGRAWARRRRPCCSREYAQIAAGYARTLRLRHH